MQVKEPLEGKSRAVKKDHERAQREREMLRGQVQTHLILCGFRSNGTLMVELLRSRSNL